MSTYGKSPIPYVDVFKTVQVNQFKRSEREGDVEEVLDKWIGKKVFKMAGSVPAANFVSFPKASTPPLGLTGQFVYIQLRIPSGKVFALHLDLIILDSNHRELPLRLSMSNLFKETKQNGQVVQMDLTLVPKWTILALDMAALVSQNRCEHCFPSLLLRFAPR